MSNKISRRTFLKCTGASAAALGAAAMLGGCGSSTSNAIEVKVGDKVTVEVLDVDLDRERISLSLKQANDSVDPASEDFDPALYGMPAEYDEQGNYKYPEGFDPATNEWIAGYEKQREEWESQYATAHDLWEQHKEFVAKELENAEASAAEDGQAPKEEKVEEVSNYSSDNTSNGTLADSDQLAALRDQLLGK